MILKEGILLVNLGTPQHPTPSSVYAYLSAFLSDPAVVDIPRALWWPLLHSVILPYRSFRVARLYQKIWMPEGSPLRVWTQRLAQRLQAVFPQAAVRISMAYGEPSLRTSLSALLTEEACDKVVILPLYPQASKTTTGVIEKQIQALQRKGFPDIRLITGYAEHPAYIDALASSVRAYWISHPRAAKLLISFHGIPLRYYQAGDLYPEACQRTATLLAEALSLKPDEWQLVYQSRFGKEPWTQPYLSDVLTQLPQQGIQSVSVISPGFAVDCLETLEEIALQNRQVFLKAGGKEYYYIPALNDQPIHARVLEQIIES